MATQVSLSLVARRIALGIRDFAVSENLNSYEYGVTGTYDAEAERIRLVVGSVRPLDPNRWHPQIREAIKRAFPEDPYMIDHIGLVVRQVPDVDDLYWKMGIGDGEVDITDMLERNLGQRA